MTGPWCRAPRTVRAVLLSCSTLVLPLLFWESCLPLGCGSRQAPGATTRIDCTDFQSTMALQPFILHPSKMPFSTNPTKQPWVARDVCRPFLGLGFVPPRSVVVGEWWVSGGLGQLHTLLATSAQSPGAVVVTLSADHAKDFQHLIYAAQLLSFCISVSLETEERKRLRITGCHHPSPPTAIVLVQCSYKKHPDYLWEQKPLCYCLQTRFCATSYYHACTKICDEHRWKDTFALSQCSSRCQCVDYILPDSFSQAFLIGVLHASPLHLACPARGSEWKSPAQGKFPGSCRNLESSS